MRCRLYLLLSCTCCPSCLSCPRASHEPAKCQNRLLSQDYRRRCRRQAAPPARYRPALQFLSTIRACRPPVLIKCTVAFSNTEGIITTIQSVDDRAFKFGTETFDALFYVDIKSVRAGRSA